METLSCVACPTVTLTWFGDTMTALTGRGLTLTVAAPVLPSLVAEMVALPCAMAVTTPLDDTVATCELHEGTESRAHQGLGAEYCGAHMERPAASRICAPRSARAVGQHDGLAFYVN
jgi:hypothetical protein